MYIPQDSPLVLHLSTSWQPARSRSLPHMHVQRWDLAQIQTCNRTNRRRTRYHCASDPAYKARVSSALFASFVEVYVLYIPQDPPLVLHVLTSQQPVTSLNVSAEEGLGSDSNRQTPEQKLNALPLWLVSQHGVCMVHRWWSNDSTGFCVRTWCFLDCLLNYHKSVKEIRNVFLVINTRWCSVGCRS